MTLEPATATAPIRRDPPLTCHFFVIPSGVTMDRLRSLDVDADWPDMRLGRDRWIVQPYARLKARGWPVELSDQVPHEGIVVYHKECHRDLLRRLPRGGRPVLVACRADFRSADEADFEVLQNGFHADGKRSYFIPFWPQPGLLPRDPARGTRVEVVAFKGYVGNLRPELRSTEFQAFLAANGLRYELEVVGERDVSVPVPAAWHDYRDVDVVLALRPDGKGEHTHKPGTKLYNAWLAGVPAILSPDYAYRELRRGPLDYLEATTVDEVRCALLKLRNDPALYAAMVANGRERGREFSVTAITARWETLLFETLPPLVAAQPAWHRSGWARRLRGARRKFDAAVRGTGRR